MQYSLPFSFQPLYTEEDFLLSSSNEKAKSWLDRWPSPMLTYSVTLLYGKKNSGKTHLSSLWATRYEARRVPLSHIPFGVFLEEFGHYNYLIIEDIQDIGDEASLFHILNFIKEEHKHLLLTSSVPIDVLHFSLPDLISRIKSLPMIALYEPDEYLLTAVMVKQFTDRHLKVSKEIIDFLLMRIERSFSAIYSYVEKLDHYALKEQRSITIPLIREVLHDHSEVK